jgi:hypothetical protein
MAVTKTSRNTISNFSRFDNTATNNASTVASQFVVVSGNGHILSSPDAITWTLRTTASYAQQFCFKRNGVLYTASTQNGMTFSTNGTSWTTSSAATNAVVIDPSSKNAIQTDDGYICSVNGSQRDGLAGDTQVSSNTGVSFQSIARFGTNIITSFGSAPYVAYSTNGITFSDATGLSFGFEQMWVTPTVAIATATYTGHIYASTNAGATWTQVRTAAISARTVCKRINGVFIVTDGTNVYTSTNGTTWNATAHGAGQTFRDGTFANGLWVLSGNNGSVLTSPDATTWTVRTAYAGTSLNGINFV